MRAWKRFVGAEYGRFLQTVERREPRESLDKAKDSHKGASQEKTGENDGDNDAERPDLFEDPLPGRRQKVVKQVMAVQRRNRDQVEQHQNGISRGEKEQEIDEDPDGGSGPLELCGCDKDPHHDNRHNDQDQVGSRSRERDPDRITANVFQIRWIEGHGLGPAEQDTRVDGQHNEGQEDRSDRVDMGDRVERQPSHKPGGRVSAPVGHGGVGCLMHGKRKEQSHVHQDDIKGIELHGQVLTGKPRVYGASRHTVKSD
jgi:hypothetical protein